MGRACTVHFFFSFFNFDGEGGWEGGGFFSLIRILILQESLGRFITKQLLYFFIIGSPARFNSIQFNSDICTRQLINYHVGARDEHRKHDPQVGDFKKKSEFSI